MEINFNKLNSYFGDMALIGSAVQFDLPSIETIASPQHTTYQKSQAKNTLDAEYRSMRIDIVYDIPFVSHVSLDIVHRANVVCHLKGHPNLHQLQRRWDAVVGLETVYNEHKQTTGEENLDEYFKIIYEKQSVEDEFNEAMEKIVEIESIIKSKVKEVVPMIEQLLS